MRKLIMVVSIILLSIVTAKAEMLISQNVSVKIGLWDKNEEGKIKHPYVIVIGPDGNKYRSNKMEPSKSDIYHSCYFPDDFSPGFTTKKGKYIWKCYSDEKEIAKGTFYFEMKAENPPQKPYATTRTIILNDFDFVNP